MTMGRTKVNSVLLLVSISSLLGRTFGLYDRTSLDNDQCSAVLEDQEVHDFRFLGPSELQPEVFTDDGVGHFSEILFDFGQNQMVVGARDTLYKLSLDHLKQLQKTEWKASAESANLCTAKGQSEEDCHNYVKVLVSLQNRIFACATHAFDPKCSWRKMENINEVSEWVDGRGKCPLSPEANSTALMTSSGRFYLAGSVDFANIDHSIFRMDTSEGFRNPLRTDQYNTMWLSQPDFVGSFETSKYIYFVFREKAMESCQADVCGQTVRSRIGRVCKADEGGQRVGKDNWTTFLKATLECSVSTAAAGGSDRGSAAAAFQFNEVQSMQFIESEQKLYATFNTPESGIAGGAVCSYNMTAVEDALSSKFLHSEGPNSVWKVQGGDHSTFECKVPDSHSSQQRRVTSNDYQLVSQSAKSSNSGPIYHETLVRYSHLAVDVVESRGRNPVHVIFVVSLQDSTVKKLSYDPRRDQSCLVQVLQPFSTSPQRILNMKLTLVTNALYLATETSVMKVPVERCSRYLSKEQCHKAMDPYCGWNSRQRACTTQPKSGSAELSHWSQPQLECPAQNLPTDGGWGKWGDWSDCNLKAYDEFGGYDSPLFDTEAAGGGGESGDNDRKCLCRKRECDSPSPAGPGGRDCQGHSVDVTNCTVHGAWTAWSEWSGCSTTCDLGKRTRSRQCGNPSPAFGGNPCVGHNSDTDYCEDLPPCNAAEAAVFKNAATPTYSDWSDWSACSAECGPGFRSRHRDCADSADCTSSCSKEYQSCEVKKCTDTLDVTDWTPWVKSGPEGNETRFRFSYRGTSLTSSRGGVVQREDRTCRGSRCQSTRSDQKASIEGWSDWSKCTRECGGGHQLKIRLPCGHGDSDSGDCDPSGGISWAERPCNVQPCPGQSWGCWSEWTACPSGGSTSRRVSHYQRRNRSCKSHMIGLHGNTCSGGAAASFEERNCNGVAVQPVADREESLTMGAVIGGVMSGFLAGLVLGAGLVFYYFRFRKHGFVHGAPHYLSAKSNNLYVSLPMLDLKNKHYPSSTGGGGDFDTLRSTSTVRSRAESSIYSGGGGGVGAGSLVGPTPKVSNVSDSYETATIKRSRSQSHRNSALLNGVQMRADLDADQLFN